MEHSIVGQVSPTQFVHRAYEESHVRIRLVSFADPADPDNIVGMSVDTRVGDPNGVGECRYTSQLFGLSTQQREYADEAYKKTLGNYIRRGILA